MSSDAAVEPLSATRRFLAIGLSVITLLCALLYWLAYAFVTAQVYAGVYGGPELLIAVTVLTLPPAIVCTVIAMVLVGPLRCKLSWISLSSFGWPYVALFAWMLWTGVANLFR
jgi:hypothetical protein